MTNELWLAVGGVLLISILVIGGLIDSRKRPPLPPVRRMLVVPTKGTLPPTTSSNQIDAAYFRASNDMERAYQKASAEIERVANRRKLSG